MTAARKVRVGSTYVYRPVMMDACDRRISAKDGDLVKVVTLPGAPKANTMGHCYIACVKTGEFRGMVVTNSLLTKDEDKARQKQLTEVK